MLKIIITADRINKIYQGTVPTQALKDVSLTIEKGEMVAVMGRSGSGKSTLLHQLGLIDTPSSGRLVIDGVDVLNLSQTRKTLFRLKHLGYVFQDYALVGELNALENVCFPAYVLAGKRGSSKEKAISLLEYVGLQDRLGHYPHQLSGGEQQRVAIARAVVNSPGILFADEPTANLDSTSAATVLELFNNLNKEFGQTIVMVTHEPEDRRYAGRIVWMKDGEIEKQEYGTQSQPLAPQ